MKSLFVFILFLLSIRVSYSWSGCPDGCEKETPLYEFKVEDCSLPNDLKMNFQEKYCSSGSISYEQPRSSGSNFRFNGQNYNSEGKCGQTAFSNLLRMSCGYSLTPEEVDLTYMNVFNEEIHWYEYPLGMLGFITKRKMTDLFPGSLPSSIEYGLNKFFDEHEDCGQRRWAAKDAHNSSEFIKNIEEGLSAGGVNLSTKITRSNGDVVKNSPVAVLIKAPNSDSLHWITVTDLERSYDHNCVVTFSSYGDEYKTSCRQLSEWSYNIQKSYSFVASDLTYVTVQLKN